ncbi:response regulator transcription factor [Pontivivens ytuae]|uniref:Response regulator transcription factor n=1 Tax=Pontivivens ytuae TaxID=2789856 RepID=A0A7S9LRC5_9RHOB|nr:response regulator transcription factor [Pontivivens ytuae]QPH53882.1 response regulator transcription factor [Pontivivens ytuae]
MLDHRLFFLSFSSGTALETVRRCVMAAGGRAQVLEDAVTLPVPSESEAASARKPVLIFEAPNARVIADTVRRVRAGHPRIGLVTVARHEAIGAVPPGLRDLLDGVIPPDFEEEDVAALLRLMSHDLVVRPAPTAGPVDEAHAMALSQRERQVVSKVALGLTNKEISSELGISQNTVNAHIATILRKTSAANRTQLAVWAARNLI